MATIEDFILKINVQGQQSVDAATKSVDNLGKSASGFGAAGAKMSSALSGIVGGMGGVVGIAGLAVGAFAGLAMKAIQMADALQDISDATGISAGSLNNFKNSLIDAGGKADDFSAFATRLTKNLGEAALGNEAAQKSFEKLGVFVRDSNGDIRDSGTVLQEVIGKLAAIPDPATRSAMAIQLLGKEAAKIDFTKVNAINDPFKDAQIAQLAKYRGAIDSLVSRINDGLITAFGSLAIKMEEANKKAAEIEAKANERGNTTRPAPGVTGPAAGVVNPFGIGAPAGERPMLPKEKEAFELQKKITEAYKDQAREMDLLNKKGKPASGDFGGESEARKKARIDSEKRFQENIQEIIKNQSLQGANDLQAIEINAANEIAKAKLEIRSKENLSKEDQDREIITKTAAIEQKAALDTARLRSQQNAKVYTELEAQRQKAAEELAAEEKRIDGIVESSIQLTVEQQNQLDAQKRKNGLLSMSAGLSDREAKNLQEIFNLEEERLAALRQIANIKDLPYAERLKREKEINEQFRQRKQLSVENQQIDKTNAENFAAGWSKAYGNFLDNTKNASATAIRLFQKFTGGLEDYFINRLKGMDGGWKKFTQGLLEEIARANLSKVIANVFNPDTGVLGGIGKIFGALTGNGFGASAASAGSSSSNPVYAYITNLGGGDTTGLDMGPQISNNGPLSGIWDSVKNTASSVFDSVKGVFGDITDTIGSIFSGGGGGGGGGGFFSGLSDLFGGFFANGGTLGAGKFGIAGENGPELISGPASITPMGGVTNVTYNINAVDAMSFKQMIAADPSFIHAVAMQGGKSMPSRR